MGMFDEVIYPCTEFDCDGDVEWQSKAGSCDLIRYSINAVSPVVALDIDGETQCCRKCGKSYTISLQGIIPKGVPMVVE